MSCRPSAWTTNWRPQPAVAALAVLELEAILVRERRLEQERQAPVPVARRPRDRAAPSSQARPGTRPRNNSTPGAPTRTVAVRRVLAPTTMRVLASVAVAGSRPALIVRSRRPSAREDRRRSGRPGRRRGRRRSVQTDQQVQSGLGVSKKPAVPAPAMSRLRSGTPAKARAGHGRELRSGEPRQRGEGERVVAAEHVACRWPRRDQAGRRPTPGRWRPRRRSRVRPRHRRSSMCRRSPTRISPAAEPATCGAVAGDRDGGERADGRRRRAAARWRRHRCC